MTIYYSSLNEAFQVNPTQVADWGYIKCSEAALARLGVEFFDDTEDPGTCRRAALLGQKRALVVLTIYNHSKTAAVIFGSSEKIENDTDFLNIFPKEYSQLVHDFDVVYFGIPT
ncbi:hypothetical protein [Comamonas composti]|uniref:hypothetical protein n=1 Tax=Comamonas composti TaxID=408558 RepID=UPI0012EBB215|nr:hypothetical protein [Comamonas composti]